VAYAHARGVIHRDLKPANVMVGAFGEVQVMDWGLARLLPSRERTSPEPAVGDAATLVGPVRSGGWTTEPGTPVGTPAYMPPGRAGGEDTRLDPGADVFALGPPLWEILTGKPPYLGDSGEEVCSRAAAADLTDAYARLAACGADETWRDLARNCLAAERSA